MNVYIVRHAQSRGNVENPENYSYLPELEKYELRDPSLTELGRRQADRLGQRLSQVEFDYIFSGPLHRHLETAYGVVRHQKKCKTVEIIPDLTEVYHENRNGLPLDILKRLMPDMEIIPSPNPTRTGGPMPCDATDEDDSPDGYSRRAHRVIDFLKKTVPYRANVLLVTSRLFGGALLIPHMLGAPDELVKKSMPFGFHNAAVSLVRFKNMNTPDEYPFCEFANDFAHLICPDLEDASKIPLPSAYSAEN